MVECFDQSKPLKTFFHLVPFNGSKSIEFDVPEAFTYNHVVNSFENETGIVFDAVTWQDASLWLVGGGAQLDFMRNKTARDDKSAAEGLQQIWRYVLHMSGDAKGTI